MVKLKPRTSTYTTSRSSMVGCFAVARARSLVHEHTTPARLRASIDPIDSRFDWCTNFVPHEPRGRTIRLTLRGTKKMISAPACSRTMGIDFLESLAPISYGDVPSLSPPVDRIMPNEGAVIMSPSESLYFWPNQCCLQLCAFHPVISKRWMSLILWRYTYRADDIKIFLLFSP